MAAPLEKVWQALIDVEQVAPCLPGAAVTGRNDDGSYSGTFTVKIGPTTASYSGKLQMEEEDEASHQAIMNAQGADKRGQGGATAKIVSRLEPVDASRTRVSVDTDYRITGRLARFGRGGMIEDISERLLREFAQRLQASLESEGDTHEVEAVDARGDAEDEPAPLAPDEAQAPEGAEAEPKDAPEEGRVDVPEPAPTDAPEPAPTDAPEPAPTDTPDAPAAAAPPRPSAPPPANEPLDAGSLVGTVMIDRIKANPWPWIAGALLLLRLLRRLR